LKNKAKSGGWTKLLSLLQTCVGGDYEATFLDYKKHALPVTSCFFIWVSDCEKEMHQWINFVVMKNLPMSFVDCPHTCSICKLKPISGQTLRRHIIVLCDIIKDTLQNELASKFVVVLDGWSEGSQHYIGVTAGYMKSVNVKDVAVQTMLSMQPLLSHGIQGMRAKDHLDHLSRILQSYGKDCCNVLCLVGNNCSVNQSMARTLNVPLIGCASHKFNLAVKRWIASQPEVAPIVNKVSSAASWVNVVCCCCLFLF
jgi:hypothetical protein